MDKDLFSNLLQEIKVSIHDDQAKVAINQLQKIIIKWLPQFENEILLYASTYNKIIKDERMNIVDRETVTKEKLKLEYSLLKLLDEIENTVVKDHLYDVKTGVEVDVYKKKETINPSNLIGDDSAIKSDQRFKKIVFLCHSNRDRTKVRELYKLLRRDGFNPWLDEENLLPGSDWQTEILKAIRGSDFIIVCLSRTSINKAGYLQKELKHALDIADEQPEGAIFIIPAKLEECEVPDRLKKWQWVNLFLENGYQRLLLSLKDK